MIQSRKNNIGVILIPDIQESYDGKETIVLPQINEHMEQKKTIDIPEINP